MLVIAPVVMNQSDDSNTQCGSNLSTGVYQLMVYDVDNKKNVFSIPAFAYYNISITTNDHDDTEAASSGPTSVYHNTSITGMG